MSYSFTENIPQRAKRDTVKDELCRKIYMFLNVCCSNNLRYFNNPW